MGRYAGRGRRTIECTRSLDISMFRKAGLFTSPRERLLRLRWDGIDSAALIVWDGHRLAINDQHVAIVHVPCPFGGVRHYFVCDCGRRVMRLHAPDGERWRCRHCHGLTYATRQATPIDRQIIKARRVREKLGGNMNLFEPFPERPPGMHRKRYGRLRDRYEAARGRSRDLISVASSSMRSRLGAT